jgi:hypothetical protein
VGYGRVLPGCSFTDFLGGEYETVAELPPETTLAENRRIVVEAPVRGLVIIPDGGALSGQVDVKSYSMIYVDGDLTGVVNVDSYATVIIEGSILGTLRVRSYTDLLLRGRIDGKIEFERGNWSEFWFDGFRSRAEIESLPGQWGAVTLHLRESDLGPGKHESVGSWRAVHVAEPAWERISGRA